jgi:hypothetical protein
VSKPRYTLSAATKARLLDVLSYDPETGIFRWKKRLTNRVKVGDLAGNVNKGYLHIRVDGCCYAAHRLAFLFMQDLCPPECVDHIDGDPTNNRFQNLRLASFVMNAENRRKAKWQKKDTDCLGVYYHKRAGRWFSSITHKGNQIYLGLFDSEDLAYAAYLGAKRVLHKGCTI